MLRRQTCFHADIIAVVAALVTHIQDRVNFVSNLLMENSIFFRADPKIFLSVYIGNATAVETMCIKHMLHLIQVNEISGFFPS